MNNNKIPYIQILLRPSLKIATFDNNTDYLELNDFFSSIEQYIIDGVELVTFIFDSDTTNYHKYVFQYSNKSKYGPKHWLLHNILYSLQCEETKSNMLNKFNELSIHIIHIIKLSNKVL